jgi:predicted nucleic acid-binding protein
MPLVLDANVAVDWFSSTSTKLADAALDAVGREGAIVPALWRWEVQDALRRLAFDDRLNMTATDALAALRALPIEVDGGITGAFGPEFVLASDYGLSVYDAAYLEVAMRLKLRLATGDKKLAVAARAAGLAFSV